MRFLNSRIAKFWGQNKNYGKKGVRFLHILPTPLDSPNLIWKNIHITWLWRLLLTNIKKIWNKSGFKGEMVLLLIWRNSTLSYKNRDRLMHSQANFFRILASQASFLLQSTPLHHSQVESPLSYQAGSTLSSAFSHLTQTQIGQHIWGPWLSHMNNKSHSTNTTIAQQEGERKWSRVWWLLVVHIHLKREVTLSLNNTFQIVLALISYIQQIMGYFTNLFHSKLHAQQIHFQWGLTALIY